VPPSNFYAEILTSSTSDVTAFGDRALNILTMGIHIRSGD
jgi:hypothetical protein